MYYSRPLRRYRSHKTRADRVHTPGIHADIAEMLAELAEQARTVTRHTPPGAPEAMARDLLNSTLAALHARQVPVEELARATGINHQAVRRRILAGNPNAALFSAFPESINPDEELGGRYHYVLTPADASHGEFTIREILGDPDQSSLPVLRTPMQALSWLLQSPPSLVPVRVSGEILLYVFAIDPGDLVES